MANYFENIPKHIRVGPFQDSMHALPVLGKNRGIYSGGCRIKLSIKHNETPQEALDTVLHEILHSIWDKAKVGSGKMTEEVIITALASWLSAVLVDNIVLLKWINEMCIDHHAEE